MRDRVEASKRALARRHDKWIKDEEAALAYLPEKDIDAARRLKREVKGEPQYTTIQIPYSYAVLMSMHTYWTTVFMGRDPVFQFSGRHGESQQQVQAMEALIAYQLQVGKMLVPLYLWLMDAGKYGIGILGTYWENETATIAAIEEREEIYLGIIPTGKMKKVKTSRQVKGYEGNKLYNVRPFDFFPDPRLPLYRFQEGEFCAVRVELGWNTLLKRSEQGYYVNTDRVMTPGGDLENTAGRIDGSSQLKLPSPSNYFFDGDKNTGKKKAEIVPAYECAIDLVPDRWGLGTGKMPEKWVFTVTEDYQTVLGAQPLGANHNRFPWDVLELEPEGYSLAKRGVPEILLPVQNTVDWLLNSHFYNVRKTLNNQFVTDPSRVVMRDFIDSAAGGVIRLKPSAYGTDTRTVVSQLPVVDVTTGHLRDLDVMLGFGQRTLGVSDQVMGMINQQGRRTAQEVRTSSTFGINRLKTNAEYFSAMGWSTLAQMLVQNSQQYYDTELKLKIVGDLAIGAGQQFIDVNPDMITGFYDFVPVDGTLPIDRFAQANMWRELFAQISKIPEIMAQYNIGRIFEWVAQLAGLKNITQFKLQVLPPGIAPPPNVVPIGGQQIQRRGPQDLGRVPEPGQISGLGTTG